MFDPKKVEDIRNKVKKWNDRVEKSLDKNPERKKDFQTASGIPVKRIFSPPLREGGVRFYADEDLQGAVEKSLEVLLADKAFGTQLLTRWET